MSGRPPTSRPTAGGDERRPVDLTQQAATQRPSPVSVDLDAIAADIEEYPQLDAADISACLAYGAMLANERSADLPIDACGMMHHSRGILDA